MKKSYEIVTPIRFGGKRIESGTVVLEANDGDPLVELGALEPGQPVKAEPPVKSDKPLAEQSLEQLQAIGKAEKIRGANLWKTPAAAVAAIEKARAAKAAG